MDATAVSDLMRDAVGLVIKLGGPMLILSMLVGVVVAIFQAVTQIHERDRCRSSSGRRLDAGVSTGVHQGDFRPDRLLTERAV